MKKIILSLGLGLLLLTVSPANAWNMNHLTDSPSSNLSDRINNSIDTLIKTYDFETYYSEMVRAYAGQYGPDNFRALRYRFKLINHLLKSSLEYEKALGVYTQTELIDPKACEEVYEVIDIKSIITGAVKSTEPLRTAEGVLWGRHVTGRYVTKEEVEALENKACFSTKNSPYFDQDAIREYNTKHYLYSNQIPTCLEN